MDKTNLRAGIWSELIQSCYGLQGVEVEGVEPSSKRGSEKVSTCLVTDLVFVRQQARDHQLLP